VPPVEAWEKVFIDAEGYASDVHAFINCTACHGGEAIDDMETAHTGLLPDPSADPEAGCGTCHPNIAPHAAESLHNTLEGYDTAIYARSSPEHYDTLETMESYHCESCHATCGDCHISQPNSVGGGLLEGHSFVQTPPMSRTCTGCHGSRVKNEYFGLNEGLPGDVHLRQARLACTDCHSSMEMHGMGAAADETTRYDGEPTPSCESCHEGQVGVGSGILLHELHGTEIISCQGCHSVAYTNCTNCHVDRTEDDVPFYSVESHSLGFYLGRNPLRSTERPWRYVPVRHVPVDVNSFDAYGDNLLDNFLSQPTWAFATPHNIQRQTPQTRSCSNCHDNDDVFLTLDKIAEAERGGANLNVMVESAPPLPENLEEILSQIAPGEIQIAPEVEPTEEVEAPSDTGGDAGFWGGDAEATEEPAGDDADFWGGDAEATEEPAGDDADFWGGDAEATEEPDDGTFWGS